MVHEIEASRTCIQYLLAWNVLTHYRWLQQEQTEVQLMQVQFNHHLHLWQFSKTTAHYQFQLAAYCRCLHRFGSLKGRTCTAHNKEPFVSSFRLIVVEIPCCMVPRYNINHSRKMTRVSYHRFPEDKRWKTAQLMQSHILLSMPLCVWVNFYPIALWQTLLNNRNNHNCSQ